MVPNYLKAKSIQSPKYSSPLKNHVEIKDDKSSYSSILDTYVNEENVSYKILSYLIYTIFIILCNL